MRVVRQWFARGSTTANERVGEATAGVTQTLFHDPKIGGIQLMVQYSHVRRSPFLVATGTPADASFIFLWISRKCPRRKCISGA